LRGGGRQIIKGTLHAPSFLPPGTPGKKWVTPLPDSLLLLANFTWLDYGVIVIYLAAMLGLGFYFSGEQKTTEDYFLGGRAFSWFPIGMSLMATLISAMSYTGLPGQAFDSGLVVLMHPVSVWIALPIIVGVVVPIYRGLALDSVYEYLELRFDARVRLLASLLFVAWRLLWLGGVIFAPCKLLILAAGWSIPDWPLLLLLGFVTTIYTVMGGMKAVIWTDVIQGMMMLGGVAIVIIAVWLQVDGGPSRVTDVADNFHKLRLVDTTFSWTSRWSLWGALPHWVLAMMSFYIADQITAQRFLSAKSVVAARNSFVLNTVALTFLLPGLVYIGVCMHTFYYEHPQQMRPEWVANVDAQTQRQITDEATRDPNRRRLNNVTNEEEEDPTVGRPLIDWKNKRDAITAENLPELVRQKKLRDPNSKEPFSEETLPELIDSATGQVQIERLAMRKTLEDKNNKNPSKFRSELVVDSRASEEVLPRFISKQLGWGVAGLIVAALLAASMSSIDSGLNSICSLLVIDLHRRYGVGRQWLAARLKKPVSELNEEDELRLAQPLTLVVGVAATLAALIVAQLGNVFTIMVEVANTFGAPLLAVFLLGMFTRRCTSAAALWSLIIGTLFTVALMLANQFDLLQKVIGLKMGGIWNVTFGTIFTLACGYLLSFFIGRPKSKMELKGFVAGCGTLGVRASDEEMTIISGPEEATRWK
jgi:SSS family transporter